MVTDSAKALALVVSAIKNLREQKGSTSRQILHYLSSVYDIPSTVARRQMQTALKRGMAYGILKKNGNHYVLPISSDSETKCQEIASQELNLLDYCRRKSRQKKLSLCCKCKKKRRRRRRRQRKRMCSCKSRRSRRRSRRRRRSRKRSRRRRRRRRKKLCTCGGKGGRRRAASKELSKEKSPNEKYLEPEVEAKDSAASVSSVASTASSITN